jgi:hypothetical protein
MIMLAYIFLRIVLAKQTRSRLPIRTDMIVEGLSPVIEEICR